MVEVSIDEIMSLRSLNFSWTKISELVGISRSTLYRRLKDAGVSTDDHTIITSTDLDCVMRDLKKKFPNDGEVMIKSHLLRIGIKTTRQDLRNSIHRTDHENTVARQSKVVKRRVYSVEHPNALWHLDSHHKLIRWRLVTHAAIDGFSRTVVYIKCCDNNKSSTVLQCFLLGVENFGLPQRIRSDHGGENIEVWRHMLTAYNDTSRVLTGSSTHNERIERLWRDVHRSVTSAFAETFYCLEAEGKLDPLNDIDLFCLHHVYLPRICQRLVEFQEAWNRHSLSTEGSKTPYQLFLEGTHYIDAGDNAGAVNIPQDSQTVQLCSNDAVSVPCNLFVPCPVLCALLLSVDPLGASTEQGKDLYSHAINICGGHLQSPCSICTTS